MRKHHDPTARLARLKALIAKERRDENGRLDNKWSGVQKEIAEIEADAKAAADAKGAAKK